MECTIDEESNPSENPTKERKFVELVSFVQLFSPEIRIFSSLMSTNSLAEQQKDQLRNQVRDNGDLDTKPFILAFIKDSLEKKSNKQESVNTLEHYKRIRNFDGG